MPANDIPEDLVFLRQQIDALDEEIVSILIKRFAVTSSVGELKALHNLASADPSREQAKLTRINDQAVAGNLNSDFIQALFQMLFDEVVKNHRGYKN